MAYQHSLVVIWPDAFHAQLTAMIEGLGYTFGEGIPLSADGPEPATYRGLHAWVQPSFVALATGEVTPEIEGYTPEQIQGALSQLIVSVDDGTGREHFDKVLDTNGLAKIEPEEIVP